MHHSNAYIFEKFYDNFLQFFGNHIFGFRESIIIHINAKSLDYINI